MAPGVDETEFAQLKADLDEALRMGEQGRRVVEMATKRMGSIRHDIDPLEKASLLLEVATFFRRIGDDVFRGLEAAQVAVATVRKARLGGAQLMKPLMLQSILCAEAGNRARALEGFHEVMEIAKGLGDIKATATAIQNIAGVHAEAHQYEIALATYRRVLDACAGNKDLRYIAGMAHANMGFCFLMRESVRDGIRHARAGIVLLRGCKETMVLQPLSVAHSVYARLLLKGNWPNAAVAVIVARRHVQEARKIAVSIGSVPGVIEAQTAEGLCDVREGRRDVGISRLDQALQKSRRWESSLESTLMAQMEAQEEVGNPREAKKYLEELMKATRLRTTEQARNNLRYEATFEKEHGSYDDDELAPILERHGQDLEQRLASAELEHRRQTVRKPRGLQDYVETLAVGAELGEDPSGRHCYRVGRLAGMLAQATGMSDEDARRVELAARLSDIGKLIVPQRILEKRGALDEDEAAIMRQHTQEGALLLLQLDIPGRDLAATVAKHHHERWDGEGYPSRLAGNAIPLEARIAGLADAFDTMISTRPYKRPLGVLEALGEIVIGSGSQFDPYLVGLFVPMITDLMKSRGGVVEYLNEAARNATYDVSKLGVWTSANRIELDTWRGRK